MLLSTLASLGRDGHLDSVAAELRPLFAALPKNEGGMLDPSVVRYALHRYFAQKYGWHFRGLEPGDGARNASSLATIMKGLTPSYIMEIFEHRLHGSGLGLEELATFAVTLSDLVRKEALSDLEDIFDALKVSKVSPLSARAMNNLLKTYLMTYITGVHTPRNSSADFIQMERDMEVEVIVWPDARMWSRDLSLSSLHNQLSRRNPFIHEYTFADVAAAVHDIGQHFGAFQNMECKSLKEKLVDMEHGGSGRVLLSKFYSGVGSMDWPFIDSIDYLQKIGALDDRDPRRLSVIIPNFLSSPSNCETPSNFYKVCCMDECEGLLAHVEIAVSEPSAAVARLVEIISELPSGTVAAPRNLSSVQVERLKEIAEHHGGRVPLHGRLFAQWMHHAYPRECRFPHVAGSTNPMTQREYQSKFGVDFEVTDEDLAFYQNNATSASSEAFAVTLPWTQAEELIAPHKVVAGRSQASSWGWGRVLALVAAVFSAAVPALHAKKHLADAACKQEKYLV